MTHTFLFTDLVGFTALTAEHGDERGAEVAIRFYREVRDLLPIYGADEVKTLGDGLILRCAEPRHGVALGLRIAALPERVSELPSIRVGVHTGPAVNRDGEWYGTTLNVAARLCAAAGGGEVLVSDATIRAAGALPKVDRGERRLHWLKNITEPVVAWAVGERACVFPGIAGAGAGVPAVARRTA